MPSFDVVSEVDLVEVNNAVDQANREIGTRFDFKGVNAKIERNDSEITMTADADFQLRQMQDILESKLIKRSVDIRSLDIEEPVASGKVVHQKIVVRQGIDSDLARKIVKMIKDQKMKVQAAIQGEKVRVTGKKRDDLQQTIAMLKASSIEQPLQYENFRD
ncbi:MAG: YajQ family cyclic di-GMP-binding protein [Pseudomonadales bacterium]|nr:YajQ family cyclic di-GMP-binding protein [Pseudomonadales bacterium]